MLDIKRVSPPPPPPKVIETLYSLHSKAKRKGTHSSLVLVSWTNNFHNNSKSTLSQN